WLWLWLQGGYGGRGWRRGQLPVGRRNGCVIEVRDPDDGHRPTLEERGGPARPPGVALTGVDEPHGLEKVHSGS
ncbi:MAG TPA: hypothetical protein VHW93_04900, partial [Acidimicrobiales bacterium]|nr:hypothetical protein [Acidimicrobiales bacterium]